MKRVLIFILINLLYLWAFQGVSYTRYYRNEQDLFKGIPLRATERYDIAHIQVLYDKYDRILSKATVDNTGYTFLEEVYEYDFYGNLIRRSIRDGKGKTKKMYVHGESEEMSRIFLTYAFPNRDLNEFKDRITVYEYLPNGEISNYLFFSVNNTELGTISFKYFDSGLVKEERWIRQPGVKTIRLYQYLYQPELQLYELTEYDSTGTSISHVGLVLPSESREILGAPETLPQRNGEHPPISVNILEESTEIIQDIRKRKAEGWDPAKELGLLFDKDILNSPDIIYLKNGDTLEVDLLQITEKFVRFKLFREVDILTMPLSDCGEIERRDGEIIYPVLYKGLNYE